MFIMRWSLRFSKSHSPAKAADKERYMNGTENGRQIDTRLVYGTEDAGKTTYISDCIRNDTFYKRGSTLILCFEQGEIVYDEVALAEKNASVAYYSGGDIRAFFEDQIQARNPGRIYVEMNTLIPELREQFPECMKVTFVITLIDWSTFQAYYVSNIQEIRQMVSESNKVTFRGCPLSKMLAPYSQAFRVMNPSAVYLRQDPMGYHEKAFDVFVPFSLDADEITIIEKEFLPFWLDSFDHPEHYNGKLLHFTDPLEIRKDDESGLLSCGRVVMTCCMADLQFMSFELAAETGHIGEEDDPDIAEGWATLDALGMTVADRYGQKKLKLTPKAISRAQAPKELIMDSRRR